jgi:long-subunit acyl-CoA synthetase (AMP-forming)
MVENQTGKRIKILWIINGGAFVNKKFQQFYEAKGIFLQFIVSYIPE